MTTTVTAAELKPGDVIDGLNGTVDHVRQFHSFHTGLTVEVRWTDGRYSLYDAVQLVTIVDGQDQAGH